MKLLRVVLLVSALCVVCCDDSPTGPEPGSREWLIGSWVGSCYLWTQSLRQEYWTIRETSATQAQHLCDSPFPIYAPRTYQEWEIVHDTLRLYLSSSNWVDIKYRASGSDVLELYRYSDSGEVWVPHVREAE